MNGNRYSHDPHYGSYTVNERIYRNNYSSNILPDTTNTHYRHSYSQPVQETNHPLNQHRFNMTHQRQQQRSHHDLTKSEHTNSSSSTSYYDRIHAQYHSNTSLNRVDQATPVLRNPSNTTDISTRIVPRPQVIRFDSFLSLFNSFFFLKKKSSISQSTIFHDQSLLPPTQQDQDDLPLDYPHYSMDLLIQRLVPTETSIPKVYTCSFLVLKFSSIICFSFSNHFSIQCYYVLECIFVRMSY